MNTTSVYQVILQYWYQENVQGTKNILQMKWKTRDIYNIKRNFDKKQKRIDRILKGNKGENVKFPRGQGRMFLHHHPHPLGGPQKRPLKMREQVTFRKITSGLLALFNHIYNKSWAFPQLSNYYCTKTTNNFCEPQSLTISYPLFC